MKRRRGGAKSTSRSPEMTKQATSPETRLRRSSTRAASLTPSKPARRHPTEALHMTTRAAGKAASTAGTDSPAASDASGSRRSSLNDSHPQPDAAAIDQTQPAPSTAHPSESPSDDDAEHQSRHADRDPMDADVPGAPDSDTSSEDHDQEPLETSKSGNKRKRSSAGRDDYLQPLAHANGVNGTSSPDDAGPPPPSTNHPNPEPPRKRARGGWRGRGRGRGRGGRGGLTLSTHASFHTDATSTPPSAGLLDRDHLSDDQQAGSERPTKQPKRLPGRRRAPNADPSVEADLRRQLQLKTAYRAVVKVLKPVLAELADRAINDVEDDPMAHEQSDQYETVKADLDAKLADRVGYLDRKLAISKEHVERRKAAELHIAETAYHNVFFNIQEDYLLRCQYELLNIMREAEKQEQDGYATEDEDGLIPRRRGMQYKWRSTGFLDPKSDSRSRFYLETEKLWRDYERRAFSRKERDSFLEKNPEEFDKAAVTSRENFTTYDADRRDHALAIYNANALADAAQAVETGIKPEPVVKTLPNEDAIGLQLLVSAIENPPPPAPLPAMVEERKNEERVTPRSTPAAEISTPRTGSGQPRSTSTPKSTRGRRGRGQSARTTPIHATARSRTSTPAPLVMDDVLEPLEPGSAMSASMSAGFGTRDPSPRRAIIDSINPYLPNDMRRIDAPIINGAERQAMAEPQPLRQPSVSSNRITDLLNKGDEPPPQMSTFISSGPAVLPPAILQPLPQPSSTPSAPLSEPPRLAAHSGQPSDSSQPGLTAQLSQPVDRSERAHESYMSTLSEPDRTFDVVGTAQQRPTTAPTEATRQEAPPARKTFWDTITIDNKSRPTSPLNADKTPLARIRQILNPSNFPRRADSPSGTTPPATATSINDRLSERPEMAPPASRASVSNDAASSRRSSGAASVLSQPPGAQPAAASPVEAPKRSNSRDKGLEQRQNRWRAAVPPQHGPTPPFRPDSNPPQNAFLKHQGWTVESQMRLSQQSAASPPQSYPNYAPPYDARAQPPGGYPPPGHLAVPPPPVPGPYNYSYPPPNPHLSAVPFFSPPFNCPPGPPPYQSIYAPPQGYPPPPPGYGAPPPQGGPPPPSHQQPGPPPPPGPPQSHYAPQYGGQPILPATIDRRSSGGNPGGQVGSPYPGSPPAHHPPAFSQQQSQYGGGGASGHSERGGRGGHGGRRRWKNTAPGTEFRPYTGPKRH
ncbi:loc733926 protein [Diplodia corticola]|uniref:Loc733926 protein n=1 Tax=Diplodia corticola TaxID=236234 RepID=A0A1J9QKV6_9PEZI|nr:loc733926 protein [Diplodia corticola]OJD28698.1 loc733926 protein [Diplodia corticola]